MSNIYSISSDHHFHDWSQFSSVNKDGVNTRLDITLAEFERQAETLRAAGGTRLFMAGDTFHTRGRITPSVMNPVIQTVKKICESGIDIYAITGNHDLEGKHSNKLGNAMQALDEIEGFIAVTEPETFDDVVMVPWIEDLTELRKVCSGLADASKDLIIHAPLNGVIKGLPDKGLDPIEVAAWGYRRVFIGHFHNHAETALTVYSIGATTHQTWSDVGTKAGFLMVAPTKVTHYPSQAPSFVNLDEPTQLDDRVKGNYVRIRYKDATVEELRKLKDILKANGALGWVDHSSKKREIRRGKVGAHANLSLEVSVASFVDEHVDTKLDKSIIQQRALGILSDARSAGDQE